MTNKLFILAFSVFVLTSCGPRSGISENTITQDNKPVDSTSAELYSPTQLNGKELFMIHCKQCHAPMENHACGEGLSGLFDRIPQTENYFNNFIKDSYEIKKSGDGYANAIDKENNVDYEHNFKSILKDAEIKDIEQYLKWKPAN